MIALVRAIRSRQPSLIGYVLVALLFHCLPLGLVALASTAKNQLNDDEKIDYALDRLTFGGRPQDHESVKRLGLKAWLKQQLHPEAVTQSPQLTSRLADLGTLGSSSAELYDQYASHPSKLTTASEDGTSRPDTETLRGILTPQQFAAWKGSDPQARSEALRCLTTDQVRHVLSAITGQQKRALLPYAPAPMRRNLLQSMNGNMLIADDLSEAKFLRAIYSTHQLEEVLADFWFNHFNVFLDKGADRYLVTSYEENVIHPHVLGKFHDLLQATAQSPAMLFYLDNWQSAGPNAPHKPGHERGLNENYARELLELHTLGVNGGYTQKDVTEVARCFTGWTIDHPRQGGTFRYNDRWHDKGVKVVLGHTIPSGGGMNDGLQVLTILARHPATAHFISFSLAQKFVSDDPPPALVARMAREFIRSDGDLREVVKAMLDSREFWAVGNRKTKLKTPFELLASAVRASNANVESAWSMIGTSQQLGEPLFRKREPNGYSNRNDDWMSAASLVGRINFVSALAQNQIPGVTVRQSMDLQALAQLLTTSDFERR